MVKAKHFDRIAPLYDFLTKVLMLGTYERVRREILALKKEQKNVLDLCTGTGYLTEKLDAENIVGIDLSRGMLEINKKKNKGRKNLLLIRGTIFYLPFKSNSFDAVYWSAATHEFMNIKPVLKEAFRILREGGSLIIFDIFNPSFIPAKFYVNVIVKYGAELGKMWVYTEKEWEELLKEAGFKKIDIKVRYTASVLIKADKTR